MSPLFYKRTLTNNHLAFLREVVRRYLQVERCRALSYTARDVVMGTVAGTEPAAEITGLANGHASKMCADTCHGQYIVFNISSSIKPTKHDQPFRLLHAVRVWLWVSQRLPLCVLSFLNLVLSAVSDEDGFASPLDDDLVSCQLLIDRLRSTMSIRTFLPSGIAARSISTLA